MNYLSVHLSDLQEQEIVAGVQNLQSCDCYSPSP